MQMIGRLSDPRKVCKSVDICQIPGQVHLLGGHKCTFGPTYWCHTTASASACRVSHSEEVLRLRTQSMFFSDPKVLTFSSLQAADYCARSVWKPIDN